MPETIVKNPEGGNGSAPAAETYKRGWKDSSFYGVMKRFAKNKVSVIGLVIILLLLAAAAAMTVMLYYDNNL